MAYVDLAFSCALWVAAGLSLIALFRRRRQDSTAYLDTWADHLSHTLMNALMALMLWPGSPEWAQRGGTWLWLAAAMALLGAVNLPLALKRGRTVGAAVAAPVFHAISALLMALATQVGHAGAHIGHDLSSLEAHEHASASGGSWITLLWWAIVLFYVADAAVTALACRGQGIVFEGKVVVPRARPLDAISHIVMDFGMAFMLWGHFISR